MIERAVKRRFELDAFARCALKNQTEKFAFQLSIEAIAAAVAVPAIASNGNRNYNNNDK